MTTLFDTPAAAISDIPDGASIMFGGFGVTGLPFTLIAALGKQGAKNLTIICNSPGGRLPDIDQSVLFRNHQVKKVITTYPVYSGKFSAFEEFWQKGELELEMIPQGTFSEKIRAGGAGIPAFYTPTGVGTDLAKGKQKKIIGGKKYVLEYALTADYALIKAHKSDKMGNLIYHYAARNFNPNMATAAKITIAEVDEIVETGTLDPEMIVTPSIFVDRVVKGE